MVANQKPEKWRWFPLSIAAAVLLFGSVLSIRPGQDEPYFEPKGGLSNLLPREITGWKNYDQPLGETEVSREAVVKTLRFDDAIYRVYTNGGLEVGVYVAYWRPGGMDPWQIALHTPDSCWVLSGANIIERDDHRDLSSGAGQLRLAQYRQFKWPTAASIQVVFWHLYGGRLSGFPVTGDEGRLRARLHEGLLTLENTRMGMVRKEQIFIRISTNRTIEEVVRSDLWPQLIEKLAPTGLLVRRKL